MEIQYVIINFLILALILFIFGRKTVRRIFGDRRVRIEQELNEAEAIENLPEEEETFEAFSAPEISDDCVNEAAAAVSEKIEQIEQFGERECREVHREMIADARIELFEEMKAQVAKIFSASPY